jgi:hypothetical protein
MLHKE